MRVLIIEILGLLICEFSKNHESFANHGWFILNGVGVNVFLFFSSLLSIMSFCNLRKLNLIFLHSVENRP